MDITRWLSEQELDTLAHLEDEFTSRKVIEMQVGTKVIRKTDASKAITAFGQVSQVINTKKVRVLWTYDSRPHHSDIAITSLLEVTPELEQDIRAHSQAKREVQKAQWEIEHPYLCTNVNPLARVSNDGHPRPLRLGGKQVVDGKCWYCGYPVILWEAAK